MKQFSKILITESVGSFIENNYDVNDDVKNIINIFIRDVDPTVRIMNAVKSLPKETQQKLYSKVKDYMKGIQKDEPISINTTQTLDISEDVGGKGIFVSFLKVLTAVDPNNDQKVDWENIPDDYLIYFKWTNIEMEVLKTVMSRYRSLIYLTQKLDYNTTNIQIFYGITNDLNFKYGFIINDKEMIIGTFTLNKSTHNTLLRTESKSNVGLRKFLLENDYTKLVIFTKLKSNINFFKPSQYKKRSKVSIVDGMFKVAYNGLGTWINGDIIQDDYDKFMFDLKQFLSRFKFKEKLQFSVTGEDHWLVILIKEKV